jgi:anti-anti-sigma regulatory factor
MREAGKTLSDLRSGRFTHPRRKRTIELLSGRGADEDAIYIVVTGQLDAAGVPRLDDELRHASASARVVILDLRALTLVDLAGALLIVRADLWITAAGGHLVVVRGGSAIERFFATLELDGLIDFVDEPPSVEVGRALTRRG